jgi:UDP-glucose 4-epimerase
LRYLITGGAGFIGSHVVDAVIARGDEVLVLDDLSTGRLSNIQHVLNSPQVEFVEGTMLDADLVDDCMRTVDACFHLASAVGVQLIIQRPLDSLLTNVRGNDIVLSAAARHRKRTLFTSTSEVYGKQSNVQLAEDSDRLLGSPFKSRWAYATAKAFGEALAHSLYRERRLPVVCTRLFNTVGPRQTGAYGMVLPRFVRQAITGDDLTVYGNGTQSRCFVHVLDTVQALTMLIDSELALGDVYNVGGEVETPIVELARRVIERTGTASKIQLVPYEEAYEQGFEELGRRHPDTGKLRQLTGWQPVRTIDDAIDDVIAHELAAADVSGRASLAG